MANLCWCEIRVKGPMENIREVRELVDRHTREDEDSRVTNFSEIVGRQLNRNWGWREDTTDDDDHLVWNGELKWSPPIEFVEEMARRFPEATLEIRFGIRGEDRAETYEFQSGESKLIHDSCGVYEFLGDDTSPVHHWRMAFV